MNFLQIVLLAVVQGLAELLPVSSSAHVILAEKLLGLDPSTPEMTFFLVMLHTGTMFAVLFYFWPKWRARWSAGSATFLRGVVAATLTTGVVGYGLKLIIERVFLRGAGKGEIEELFANFPLIATALAAAGVLILVSDSPRWKKRPGHFVKNSWWIGAVQGLCLPFRGFSRSGATISVAMIFGEDRALSEEFSFALAVVLTPPVIARELHRLMKTAPVEGAHVALAPGLVGMALSFVAGWVAIRWLSAWLEAGRWGWFGYYCLAFSALIFSLHFSHAL